MFSHRSRAVVLGVVLVLAGCVGTNPLSPPTTSNGTNSPVGRTPTVTPSEVLDPGHGRVPYELGVDNTGNNQSRQVSVVFYRLENGTRSEAVFNETITVAQDDFVTRNITFPTVGEYLVVVGLESGQSVTHRYQATATNPETAVVIGIKDDGTVMVATYYN